MARKTSRRTRRILLRTVAIPIRLLTTKPTLGALSLDGRQRRVNRGDLSEFEDFLKILNSDSKFRRLSLGSIRRLTGFFLWRGET